MTGVQFTGTAESDAVGAVGIQGAVVPMRAVGKARPRVTANGTYMPRRYTEARDELRQAFGPVTLAMPVAIEVTAVRKLPQMSKAKRAAMMGAPCMVKPDADNILGWAMDALFEDDAAVVEATCRKVWGAADEVRIVLREVGAEAVLL